MTFQVALFVASIGCFGFLCANFSMRLYRAERALALLVMTNDEVLLHDASTNAQDWDVWIARSTNALKFVGLDPDKFRGRDIDGAHR